MTGLLAIRFEPVDKTILPSQHPVPERVVERFWDRVERGGPDDCWPWLLSIANHGYGQVGWGVGDGVNAMTTAHRVAWLATHGPIPEGMTVDHVCRNRVCCNPAHLRLLSNVENARDNGNRRKTHCPAGHPYDTDNTYRTPRGHRQCRACGARTNRRDHLIMSTLAQVKRKATKFHKLRDDIVSARDAVDAVVLDAKMNGATYKELAEASGLSIAWVQTSLQRSGYATTPRSPATASK